jgi:hypothetical protein
VNAPQLSRDGKVLLATSNDQIVSLYDVATLTRLGDPIPTAAPFIVPGWLRPDGDAVAVTRREGRRLWDIDPAHLADGSRAATSPRPNGTRISETSRTTGRPAPSSPLDRSQLRWQ